MHPYIHHKCVWKKIHFDFFRGQTKLIPHTVCGQKNNYVLHNSDIRLSSLYDVLQCADEKMIHTQGEITT